MGPALPDEEIVRRQIGRPPRGPFRVERRCAYGYPTVVRVHPLAGADATPFPTLFWLTCPILVEQVSRRESAGGVAAMERDLAADPALRARFDGDARAHAAERAGLLSDGERAGAAARGVLGVIETSGVGGVRVPGAVKCLHAHYAHHLVRGNAVGRRMEEGGPLVECTPDDVRCARWESEGSEGVRSCISTSANAGSLPAPGPC